MGHSKFIAYRSTSTPRYIVTWGLQWQIIDCQRLEPAADLTAAMAAAIRRLATEDWVAEGEFSYGFVFVRCRGERRLLMLTSRDPFDALLQSFDPFKNEGQRNARRW